MALIRCTSYAPDSVLDAVDSTLTAAGYTPSRGERVLVKPNLLKAQAGGLCCTHPHVVTAACQWLLDHGAQPFVGDSPAFGSAAAVAKQTGLTQKLSELDTTRGTQLAARICTLDSPVSTRLPSGIRIGISRTALEADAILNVPRLKAHTQMGLSVGVKNLFGCVSGVRKAIAHTCHGDNGNAFRTLLIECALALPPCTTLLDGIVAMDRTGPANGDPCDMHVVAAATDPFALDTAIYALLRCSPQAIPLWHEARQRGMPQAFRAALSYPLLTPDAFDASHFRLPQQLTPETFHPLKLAKSACKRFWKRYCDLT